MTGYPPPPLRRTGFRTIPPRRMSDSAPHRSGAQNERLCAAPPAERAGLQRLAQHAKQHSRTHMVTMWKLMRRGHSFDQAHARAMETVGQ